MKKKDLEIKLQSVKNFIDPDPSLEQYMTPPVIASDILFTAYSEGDIFDADVNDLGCGTGMFSIGSRLLGAKNVHGFDVSEKAIAVAKENAANLNADVVFEVCDVDNVTKNADTAIMNPPFGCQTKRADRKFLDKAMELCNSVYSLHMASTYDFLEEYVNSKGREICFKRSYRFNIPHTFSFHSKSNREIDIIMIIIR